MKVNILVSLTVTIALSFFIGLLFGIFVISTFLPVQSITYTVHIVSIEENQEVHSVVIIDASVVNTEEIEVLINGKKVANYVPYYWNNILEPIGEYEIVVRCLVDGTWIQDQKIVIIPEEFIVPLEFNFTEDFVVHKGQTVTFNDSTWRIGENSYENGWTPISEKTFFAINVFGDLILNNASIECATFTAEDNGTVVLKESSQIIVNNRHDVPFYDSSGDLFSTVLSSLAVRFDDEAILKYDNTMAIVEEEKIGNDSYILFSYNTEISFIFNEDATYLSI